MHDFLRRGSVCLVLYVALVIVSFYPQSMRPHDTIGYIGDSLYCVYVVGWIGEQILSDPLNWTDATLLYPNPRPLAFGDHQLLPSLLVSPVYWVTGNAVLGYNISIALACLLAAFALRRLALRLGLEPVGAWAAGALYAFHTYQVNEGPRLMIIYHGFIPLALAELLDFLQTGERKHLWRLAAVMFLQGLSSSYHLAYGSFLIGLITLLFVIARPVATMKKLPRLAGASMVAAAVYLAIILPYARNAMEYSYARGLPTGIDLAHYVSTSPTNLWYGAIGAEVRIQQQGPHFIGFLAIAGALLALGAWAFRRGSHSGTEDSVLPPSIWVPFTAAFALLVILLSAGKDVALFGHAIGPGPYRLLFEYVPGFQFIRIPERLGLIAMAFVALLAGRAISLIASSGWRRLALLLALLLPLEHLSPLPVTDTLPVGDDLPAVYDWVKENPVRAIAEVPIHGESLIRKETLEMYFSLRHLKPIIHGYPAYTPLVSTLLRRMADQFPDDVSLSGFQQSGVDTIVLHRDRPGGESVYERVQEQSNAGRVERLARFSGAAANVYEGTTDEVYRIISAPQLASASRPKGRRLIEDTWNYRTKRGDPAPAADGDMATAWTVRGPLAGDEFYEITFGRSIRVSGVVLRLRQDSLFPTRFKIAARRADGLWVPLAFYDAAHQLQLLEQLLEDHTDTELGFDWVDQDVTGIRVMLDGDGHSALGWLIPEIEVLVPES